MRCPRPFSSRLGFCISLVVASATTEDCRSISGGSCPDPTTLLQSRVQLEQVQDEQEAAAVDVEFAISSVMSSNPSQFLIISSPSAGKIVWTMRRSMQAGAARAFTLIDHGVKHPKGLAFDHKHGYLYIADSGAEKIFRYTLLIDKSAGKPRLATTHVRLTIVENCGPVEWVTLDDSGNLFYSARNANNVNKIDSDVVRKLGTGEVHASALTVISEKTLQAQQVASKAKALISTGFALPTDAPPVLPHIQSIYEAKLNAHVARPAAILVDGPHLYWTNQEGGSKAGAVVQGQVDPKVEAKSATAKTNFSKSSPLPFPTVALTKTSSGALGLAKAKTLICFTRNQTIINTAVTCLSLGTNIEIDFLKDVAGARALVWDREQTMYVADEVNGEVLGFPVGRIMANAPRTRIVSIAGAYGLTMTSSADPWFNSNTVKPIGHPQ